MDASINRTSIVRTRGMTSQRWDPPRRLDDRGGIAITPQPYKDQGKEGAGREHGGPGCPRGPC